MIRIKEVSKLFTNGVQGMLFSVAWKYGQEYLEKKKTE